MSKDTIYRQDAIDAVADYIHDVNKLIGTRKLSAHECEDIARRVLGKLPSARAEITDEQAILHLQSTGWMQNHDREMYESGLREQLADDSGSYDSLIPSVQAEPREVVPHRNYQYLSDYWCQCGWHLGKKGDVKYCPDCGRKVKWDG